MYTLQNVFFKNLTNLHMHTCMMSMTIIKGCHKQVNYQDLRKQYTNIIRNVHIDRNIDCSETYKRRLQWSFFNFPFHWRHKPKIKQNAHKYNMSRNEKWHIGRACCKLYAFINGATFSVLDFRL